LVASMRTPGTFHQGHDDMNWHCLDQVLVSNDLFDESLSPVIRQTMMSRPLVDAAGEPLRATDEKGKLIKNDDKPVYDLSDHLPVELIIPGKVVKSACERTPRGQARGERRRQ
jgi:hypothetical protein